MTIRTINDEYLIAMKLKSFRSYKFDWSDIVGIVNDMSKIQPVTFAQIDKAVNDLYGGWESISKNAHDFIQDVLQNQNKLKEFYDIVRNDEIQNQIILSDFEKQYDGVLTADNLEDILKSITQKEDIMPHTETLDDIINANTQAVSQQNKQIDKCIDYPRL